MGNKKAGTVPALRVREKAEGGRRKDERRGSGRVENWALASSRPSLLSVRSLGESGRTLRCCFANRFPFFAIVQLPGEVTVDLVRAEAEAQKKTRRAMCRATAPAPTMNREHAKAFGVADPKNLAGDAPALQFTALGMTKTFESPALPCSAALRVSFVTSLSSFPSCTWEWKTLARSSTSVVGQQFAGAVFFVSGFN